MTHASLLYTGGVLGSHLQVRLHGCKVPDSRAVARFCCEVHGREALRVCIADRKTLLTDQKVQNVQVASLIMT